MQLSIHIQYWKVYKSREMIKVMKFWFKKEDQKIILFFLICFPQLKDYCYPQSSFRFETYLTSGSTNAAGFSLVFAVTRPRWPYGISFRSGKSAGVNASARLLLERRKKWLEKKKEGDGEGGTWKEQMKEESITVPSFPRLANSFQGSRTLSTEPNSKVIAPVPATSWNPYNVVREFESNQLLLRLHWTSNFICQVCNKCFF